jgi:hypothetical protein
MYANTYNPMIRLYVRNAIRNATTALSIGFPDIRHRLVAVAVGTTIVPVTPVFSRG